MIEIPLTSSPEQLFSITLEGNKYDIRVILNSRTSIWSIDFSQNGALLVAGVAILSGVDMLDQYNLPIKNMYVVNLDNPNLDPSIDNLGVVSKLFILTDEEVAGG